MIFPLTTIYRSRDLLWAWTMRNIRARYQQSALGWLWAVIQPLATVVIFTIIFTLVVPVDTGDTPYQVFAYIAIVPWTFLASSLSDMSGTIVANMSLVTKIYFPREILPIAAMLARLLDFAVAAALFLIMMLYYQMPFYTSSFLYLPIILAIQVLLIMGLGLATAAVNVFYRDVQSLLALILQLWFYLSPIIYPISMVPTNLQIFYYLNPMAGLLEAYRAVLLNGQAPGNYLLLSALVSSLVFIFGFWLFKRVEFLFADIV
jgi:lipopolysaccharide transport system permease protein